MTPLTDPLRPGQRLGAGRYQVARRVGAGGFSAVYEAADRQRGGQRVALKVLSATHAAAAARLRHEALALQRVAHPRLVRCLDVGYDPLLHALYLVMPFLDGPTLAARLTAGPLAVPAALTILEDIAEALDALHAAGFLHRDIKPSNVILSGDRATLIDLGLALPSDTPEDRRVTAPNRFVGTPLYISPEARSGSPLDARADLYSLAALAHHLFTGAPPALDDPPPPASALPPAADALLRAALATRPDNRPAALPYASRWVNALHDAFQGASTPAPTLGQAPTQAPARAPKASPWARALAGALTGALALWLLLWLRRWLSP
jgi:eukaryotic-like serine/threonine-protein kinase